MVARADAPRDDDTAVAPSPSFSAGSRAEVEAALALLATAERRAGSLAELTSLMNEVSGPLQLAERSVELMARATGASALLVYLWDAEQDRLVLRVANERWHHAVDVAQLRLGEGVTGWCALMRQTVVINDDPRNDPRSAQLAELDDGDFGSMMAVPILKPEGDVLGVFTLWHLDAQSFVESDVSLATEVGTLLASGLTQAETMTRLRTQSAAARFLADLPAEAFDSLDRCLEVITGRLLAHLDADACMIELTDRWAHVTSAQQRTAVARDAAARFGIDPDALHTRASLMELGVQEDLQRLRIPLGSAHPIGAVTGLRRRPFTNRDVDLAEAVSAQAAAAIMALTGRDLVAPVFDQIVDAADDDTAVRLLTSLGWRPGPTRVVMVRVEAAAPEFSATRSDCRAELADLVGEFPGSVAVRGGRDDLLALTGTTSVRQADGRLTELVDALRGRAGVRVTAGVGPETRGPTTLRRAIRQSMQAFRWAELAGVDGRIVTYDSIAHLRLLPEIVLSMSADIRDVVGDLSGLVSYDLANGTELARTLDSFVANRGSVVRTSDQLFVHRNTLRQRLRRIEELTGRSPEDFTNWVTAGLAVRMVERSEREIAEASGDGPADGCPRGVAVIGLHCCGTPQECELPVDRAGPTGS